MKNCVILRRYKVGSVILFERKIESIEQVKELTKQLQELSSDPPRVGMLIGTDQEERRVNKLPGEKGGFPSARELASSG